MQFQWLKFKIAWNNKWWFHVKNQINKWCFHEKKNTQRGHIKCKQIVDEKNSTTHHGLLDTIVDGTLIASWGTVKKKKKKNC